MKFVIPLVAISLLLIGCGGTHSNIPSAKTYPENDQLKFQATHHWDVLASKQAELILASIPSKVSDIYIKDTNVWSSPFEKAYRKLLITHLVKQGGSVLTKPEKDTYKFSYNVQVVSRNRQGPDTVDQSDFDDSTIGRDASETLKEVLVTTTGIKNNVFVMSDSQVFYLWPENLKNYRKYPRAVHVQYLITDK